MKSHFLRLFYSFLLLLSIISCAKRGTPDGGAIDITPPEFLRARPENFTTNFNAGAIKIYFNEYVKLTDPQRQIIISPPIDPRPEITPLGTANKSITIDLKDAALQPNTTYTINFGRSITDNNEGNPLSFFTYAFSTGAYIDSLTVAGNVSDALLKTPDPFISVLLYEVDSTYTDSAVYDRLPRYVTNTLDSTTTFELKNLKEGTYQLVGLRDLNNNYKFDPGKEKIAFADEYITIPTESVFDLILFKELLEGKFVRPQQKSGQHLLLGYTGTVNKDSLEVSVINALPDDFESRITKDQKTDTLHYWYKPQLQTDSLKLLVSTRNSRDTLLTRLKEMKKDSLQFSFQPQGTVNYDQEIKILPTIPLSQINDTLVQVKVNDSVPVPFTSRYDEWKNEYIINFEKSEKKNYKITALPGAFTDFFGKVNDTVTGHVKTLALADYGNLTINLQGAEEFPLIAQLTTEKGEVQAEQYLTDQTVVNFKNIKPGKYLLRLVYDRNGNRKWDSGSFLGKRQPEKIVYYPDVITARANWDDVYPFIVE